MFNKIEICQSSKEALLNALEVGLDLEEALLYATISKFNFLKVYINYKIVLYSNYLKITKDEELNEGAKELKLSLVSDETFNDFEARHFKELERLKTDKGYASYMWECFTFIEKVKQSRTKLERKLLNDLQKAPESKGTGYTASEFLLERLFKSKYGKDALTDNDIIKSLPPVNITFTKADQSQQQRYEELENIVQLELNGDNKGA